LTLLRSPLLTRERFCHGFGTRRSIPDDFPTDTHILLQVHGEKIVVLTADAEHRTQDAGENLKMEAESRHPRSSGIWNLPFDKAQGPEPVEGESGIGVNDLDIKIVALPRSPFRFDEGDAMVSGVPGVAMGIRTADCLPILIADRLEGTAAAVHCGWRSLALGLAGKAVRAMGKVMGSDAQHLVAAIGPSIGPCCYEVGQEVRDAFPAGQIREGLFETRKGRLFMDLASGAKTQLIAEGMAPVNIDEIAGCTSCNPGLFWSHRARGEEERMVSFITVREAY